MLSFALIRVGEMRAVWHTSLFVTLFSGMEFDLIDVKKYK
jgi:hypothetical protein